MIHLLTLPISFQLHVQLDDTVYEVQALDQDILALLLDVLFNEEPHH